MNVTLTKTKEVVIVEAPYTEVYSRKARQRSGSWQKPIWVFPLEAERAVRDLNFEVYGIEGDEEVVPARLTFKENCSADRGPVVLAGCLLANARDRDSGATTGAGVIFERGKPLSGGSWKNWTSKVPPGSIVQVKAPRSALEALQAKKEIEVEFIRRFDQYKAEFDTALSEGLLDKAKTTQKKLYFLSWTQEGWTEEDEIEYDQVCRRMAKALEESQGEEPTRGTLARNGGSRSPGPG